MGLELCGLLGLALVLVLARERWVVPALAVVALPEGAALALGGPVALCPLLGPALLLSAELAFWSLEGARPAREALRLSLVRILWLLLLALGGGLAALLTLGLAAVPLSGGAYLTLCGVLAAVLLLALVGWAGRRALLQG